MTDLDHEAAEITAEHTVTLGGSGDHVSRPNWNVARCYLASRTELEASRAREKRLEALVRSLGKCVACDGTGDFRFPHDKDCDDCAGTGLVEAAREELENG